MDLSALSLDELKNLQKEVETQIKSFNERKKQAALAEMRAVAEKHGLSLSDVMGSSAKSGGIPKYRNPNNALQTWTGKGRNPKWFEEAVAAGTTPESMAI